MFNSLNVQQNGFRQRIYIVNTLIKNECIRSGKYSASIKTQSRKPIYFFVVLF